MVTLSDVALALAALDDERQRLFAELHEVQAQKDHLERHENNLKKTLTVLREVSTRLVMNA
jgi:FtsZ-binding cell division protein ZapB